MAAQPLRDWRAAGTKLAAIIRGLGWLWWQLMKGFVVLLIAVTVLGYIYNNWLN